MTLPAQEQGLGAPTGWQDRSRMRGGRTHRHGLDPGHRRHPCGTRFPALTLVILGAETVRARGVCRSLPIFAVSGAAAFLRLMAPNPAPAMIGAKHRLVLPMSAGLDALLLLADARFRFVDHVAALTGESLIAAGAPTEIASEDLAPNAPP
ncbi:hypothetical protein [Falsirhodobacter xinxiangensis]|uniref:hypothetical protein n=1 Tax=Falsirhodobacter xinxiangensis TaxID=2530049 RepID=UPI0010AA3C6D|nr:hypothetical protein [Rhodobacter xinxiangensis]